MKSIVGFPNVVLRRLLTVNSTSATALAGSGAAVLPVAYNPTFSQRVNATFCADTVAATAGRWIDIATVRSTPYVGRGGTSAVETQVGPEAPDTDVDSVFVPPRLMLVPVGGASDGNTFTTQVFAGRPWADSLLGAPALIAPQPAVSFLSTLSARPTTSSGFTNEKFCDALAYTTSEAASKAFPCEIQSVSDFANYTFGAAIVIQTQGARFWFIRGVKATGITNFNWLWGAF